MTPIASAIMASRAGNAKPDGIASGKVSMPASVMAPRTPAVAVTASRRVCGIALVSPRMAARKMVSFNATQTQAKRRAPSMSVISAA